MSKLFIVKNNKRLFIGVKKRMLIEKFIFNILAFSLFIIIFSKLIRKNDTNYVFILVLEAIGIGINFLELLIGDPFTSGASKVIMYLIANKINKKIFKKSI